MSQADQPEDADVPMAKPRRRWLAPAAVFGLLLLAGLAWAWLDRKDIAANLIATQLEKSNLPATYTVEDIGARRQVLRDIVIGDPRAPDFTAERIEVAMTTRWGLPGLGRITLVKPRLYGSYRAGKLSFGKLDPLIFTESTQPFSLPDLDIAVVDGRGLLDSDFGAVGFKLEGEGALRGGFKGMLAATTPDLAAHGCTARGVTAYGALSVSAEKPRFKGPLRLVSLACPQQALKLGKASLQADVTADPRFDGVEGALELTAAGLAQGTNRAEESNASGRFVFRKQALTVHYDAASSRVDTPSARLGKLSVKGTLRSAQGLERLDIEGDVTGSGLAAGLQIDAMLADLQRGGEGSLAAPLVAQLRQGLQREARASDLVGQFIARRTGDLWNLVVPQARIKGSSGQGLLTLSRVQLSLGGPVSPRISGNFTTGGQGLPRIAGRLERAPGGQLVTRLVVAEYRAGSASIAMPQLMLVQSGNGAFGFSGEARVSGDLPGGQVRNLVLPLKGNWTARTGLALWRQCTRLAFDRLQVANLAFDRRSLLLCPARGGAIVRTGARGGLAIAAGVPSLDITGRLGETPIRIASGPIGFAYPGTVAARSLDVALGPAETASRFRIANVTARTGGQMTGTFSGSDIRLSGVPLDLLEAAGDWRFAGGQLVIDGGQFRLVDRQADARFQPLIARDAVLTLADNRILAQALLREPGSDRQVLIARIGHNLAGGIGHADLDVPNITFDKQLQPDTLSRLALGIIANAEGSVAGAGRVDWTPDRVTSSGTVTTGGLDFAAAFGPVKGVAGSVVFTDLLGLVTAPDQRLQIASINPGIEAENGELSFELQGNNVLQVNGAHWPFLDGTLLLEPTRMVLGVAETRRYTMVIAGLDAAQFVNRLQLTNITATGIFDGRLPLVFDENGGRIDGGLLISRVPGGNVSYIGPLTYKDMSPMVNFAFDALKSINFKQMRIGMDGALEGEIVTRVSFEGIRQGKGTKQNFVTKSLAKLPIRFNVNIRAPFFRLMSSFKSLYDPGFIVDPRLIGLVDGNGVAMQAAGKNSVSFGVQPPESENKR